MEGSKGIGSDSISKVGSGFGKTGRERFSDGEIVANRGNRSSVWG